MRNQVWQFCTVTRLLTTINRYFFSRSSYFPTTAFRGLMFIFVMMRFVLNVANVGFVVGVVIIIILSFLLFISLLFSSAGFKWLCVKTICTSPSPLRRTHGNDNADHLKLSAGALQQHNLLYLQ